MNMKKTTHLPFIATAFLLCGLCIAGCKKTEVDNAGVAEAPAQPDTYMSAIDRYLIDSIASQYQQGDVCIPFTMLVDADASDSTDIKVWGTFWVDNYTIVGDTLKTVSGGSHPGLMHVAKTSDGYRVTSFDAVGDGASFDPTARQIFGDKFEEFSSINSDESVREEMRKAIIADYVKSHDLPVKVYQDYGWPAVEIPTE